MISFYRSTVSLQLAKIFGFILLSYQLNAAPPTPQQSDENVRKLYQSLNDHSYSDMAARLNFISSQFLGKPYVLGSLGEGPSGRYDQSPLYRFDGFDCETYVDTVLAIALANDNSSFQQCIKNIRYWNAQVDFLTRNHFMSLDWNPNNQQQGFIADITTSFKNQKNESIAKMAVTLIDKPSWYQHFNLKAIKLSESNGEEKALRLAELKAKGRKLPIREAQIPYLPFDALFDKNGNPDKQVFAQIPNASIIEIVRPNWDLKDKIGTNLDVSHLGFAFWKDGTLMFRQASSIENKIIEVPLVDYLRNARSSPTIKGINVQQIVPKQPISNGCSIK
jgi:hypothetical protein